MLVMLLLDDVTCKYHASDSTMIDGTCRLDVARLATLKRWQIWRGTVKLFTV
jgi:hypothetical protein